LKSSGQDDKTSKQTALFSRKREKSTEQRKIEKSDREILLITRPFFEGQRQKRGKLRLSQREKKKIPAPQLPGVEKEKAIGKSFFGMSAHHSVRGEKRARGGCVLKIERRTLPIKLKGALNWQRFDLGERSDRVRAKCSTTQKEKLEYKRSERLKNRNGKEETRTR